MKVKLSEIQVDENIQLRKRWIDQNTVQAYIEALGSGAEFPPVVAFQENDNLWLADGFHRIAAYRFLGLADVDVDIHEGTRQDAMVYAATANVMNGKPMSQEEKREAGKRLLKLTKWSQAEIARQLAVTAAAVSGWTTSINKLIDRPQERTVTRAGTNYTMDVSNIGQPKQETILSTVPLPTSKPFEYETIEEVLEDINKGCHNCTHCEADGASDYQYWCHAMGQTIRIENDPCCKLEQWQDDGSHQSEIIEAMKEYDIGPDTEWPTSIELLQGDFTELGPQLKAESFDLILTDPPYGKDSIHLYELLAKESTRLLKPGGSLLAMIGQLCLPETLALMTPYLNYHWTISYDTPGGQSPQIWPRKVNTFWKPILWFVKGQYEGVWHGDKIKSNVNDNDKRFHDWGQSESGIGKLVSEFAFAGAKVLDPFLGGGTTAIVCYRLRIPFTGIDISKEAIETTRNRILQEINSGK